MPTMIGAQLVTGLTDGVTESAASIDAEIIESDDPNLIVHNQQTRC